MNMATKTSTTVFLVLLVSSISNGEECSQERIQLASLSYLQCVKPYKAKFQLTDDMDIEETCRTVDGLMNKCYNEKLKKPLENCENEEMRAVKDNLEEAQKGQLNFLCYDNGRYLKVLKENDGTQCNHDLMEAVPKNCPQKESSSNNKEMNCQEDLEKLNCLKKSFPDTCKEIVKKILYTSIKKERMLMGCREFLMENDVTDFEIKLSSAVMTKTNLGLLVTMILTLILF